MIVTLTVPYLQFQLPFHITLPFHYLHLYTNLTFFGAQGMGLHSSQSDIYGVQNLLERG